MSWLTRGLIADCARTLPVQEELHIHHLGGAMGRVPTGATAFTDRSSPFIDNCIAGTPEPAQLAGEMEWARAAGDAMAAYGSGRTYVNFTGLGAGDKAKLSCPPGFFSRLQSVKDRYDPTNVFRLQPEHRSELGGLGEGPVRRRVRRSDSGLAGSDPAGDVVAGGVVPVRRRPGPGSTTDPAYV